MRSCAELPTAALAKLRLECTPPDDAPYVTTLYADDEGSQSPRVTISLHDGGVFVSVNRAMRALARQLAPIVSRP